MNPDPTKKKISYREKLKCAECTAESLVSEDKTQVFQYVPRWDCWACAKHNVWIEVSKCSDETCYFCVDKPEKPF